MKLARDELHGRYYDADRYPHGADRWPWWIAIVGLDKEDCEEIDVWARDYREAREVTKAAIEADYDPNIKILEVSLA
jgi:hypothetical protein